MIPRNHHEFTHAIVYPSYLVRNLRNMPSRSPGSGPWGPKARRWYQRILSGVTHHTANRRRLRVMTLTSSLDARDPAVLNDHFQILRKRILRRWPRSGFEYWKLRTSEGNGVLHIIYSGPYIPIAWLRQSWKEIHGGSYIVYLQQLRGKRKRVVNYLIGHYLPAHDDHRIYARMSWSWGWVFRGFAGAWRWIYKQGPTYGDAIVRWTRLMRRDNPLFYYKMARGLLFEQTILKKRWEFDTRRVCL